MPCRATAGVAATREPRWSQGVACQPQSAQVQLACTHSVSSGLPEIDPEMATGSIYSYIQSFGIFGLLRPALVCCDKDRPADPKQYIATFLSSSIQKLE